MLVTNEMLQLCYFLSQLRVYIETLLLVSGTIVDLLYKCLDRV